MMFPPRVCRMLGEFDFDEAGLANRTIAYLLLQVRDNAVENQIDTDHLTPEQIADDQADVDEIEAFIKSL